MHASVIGHYKQAEIRLVGEGAGTDIVGPDYSQISKTDVDEILGAFPRLELKRARVSSAEFLRSRYSRAVP